MISGWHAKSRRASWLRPGVEMIARNVKIYDRLFKHYRALHDSFGVKGTRQDLSGVMKDLLEIRDAARGN